MPHQEALIESLGPGAVLAALPTILSKAVAGLEKSPEEGGLAVAVVSDGLGALTRLASLPSVENERPRFRICKTRPF